MPQFPVVETALARGPPRPVCDSVVTQNTLGSCEGMEKTRLADVFRGTVTLGRRGPAQEPRVSRGAYLLQPSPTVPCLAPTDSPAWRMSSEMDKNPTFRRGALISRHRQPCHSLMKGTRTATLVAIRTALPSTSLQPLPTGRRRAQRLGPGPWTRFLLSCCCVLQESAEDGQAQALGPP